MISRRARPVDDHYGGHVVQPQSAVALSGVCLSADPRALSPKTTPPNSWQSGISAEFGCKHSQWRRSSRQISKQLRLPTEWNHRQPLCDVVSLPTPRLLPTVTCSAPASFPHNNKPNAEIGHGPLMHHAVININLFMGQ